MFSVGYFGEIWHTKDGGKTWAIQNSGLQKALFKIKFLNNHIGYAVGGEGTVIHTKDGGVTWGNQESKTKNQLFDLRFINERENINFSIYLNKMILITYHK